MTDQFVAVVTGASSGIGEATARRLAREPGAKLVLVARRRERLDALARELGGATVVAVDLTEPSAPAEVLAAVGRAHGELHLLVNNAGASWRGGFAETGWENVERHMKVNFEAPVRLTDALLPLLRATAAKGAPAAIVNVSSTSARVGRPRAGAYSASKFALAGWSEAMAVDLAGTAVEVKLALPGPIDTEIWDQPENDPAAFTGPFIPPEECATAIARALEHDGFEYYVPPEMPGGFGLQHDVVVMKTADTDAFIRMMGAFEEQSAGDTS